MKKLLKWFLGLVAVGCIVLAGCVNVVSYGLVTFQCGDHVVSIEYEDPDEAGIVWTQGKQFDVRDGHSINLANVKVVYENGYKSAGWTLSVDGSSEKELTDLNVTITEHADYVLTAKAQIDTAGWATISIEGSQDITILTTSVDVVYGGSFDVNSLVEETDYILAAGCTLTGWTLYVNGTETEMTDGTFTVAKAGEDETPNSYKLVPVIEEDQDATVEITSSVTEMYIGVEALFKATVNGQVSTVTWISSDETIATVSEDGRVRALAAGTVQITAKYGEASDTVSVTISHKPVYSISVDTDTLSLAVGGEAVYVDVTVVAEYSDNTAWGYTVNTEGIVTIELTDTGLAVSPEAAGDAVITVYADGNNSKTATITVSVADYGIELSQPSVAVTVGGEDASVEVTVTATNSENTAWSAEITEGADCITIDTTSTPGSIIISALSAGTATITVTADGDPSTTATITVNVSDFCISVDQPSVDMVLGRDDADVTVTVTASNSDNTAWTSEITSGEECIEIKETDTGLAITAKAAGTAVITVTADGNGATATITVNVSSFNVAVDAPTVEMVVNGDDATVGVTVTPSNSENAGWSASITAGDEYITIDTETTPGSIIISAKAIGTATITVTADGDDTKTATITVYVENFTISVDQSTVSMLADSKEAATVTVTVTAANSEDIDWDAEITSGEGIVSITSDKESKTISISALQTGNATIIVTADGDHSKTATINVTVSSFAISVDNSNVSMVLGKDDATVTITVTPTNSDNSAWAATSSAEGVATVTASGESGDTTLTITAKGAGSATITVTAAGDKTKTATITVNVSSFSISVGSTTASMVLGGDNATVTVTVTASNSSNEAWTAISSDKDVATVTESGESSGTLTITAVGAGNATITVTASGDSTKTAIISVTVADFAISVDPTSVDMVLGGEAKTATVTVTASYSDNTSWTASSSDTDVATVTASGNSGDTLSITAVGAGTATITVYAAGNGAKTATISVSVSSFSISVAPAEVEVAVNGESSVSVAVTANNSDNTKWAAEITQGNDLITIDTATTENTIIISGVATGTATITVTADGDSSKTATITVTIDNFAINLGKTTVDMVVGGDAETVSVEVQATNSEDTDWDAEITSGGEYITIDTDTTPGSIIITAVKEGTAVITVTADGDKTKTATITVKVSSFSIEVGKSSVEMVVGGDDETVSVTVTPVNSDNTAWTASSSDTGIATVTENGEVNGTLTITAVGAGNATITVKAAGDPTKTAIISVSVSDFSISVGSSEVALVYVDESTPATDTVSVTVTADNSTNTAWTASSSNTDVATVTESGDASGTLTITAVSAGTATITVTASGNGATAIITVNVSSFSISAASSEISVDVGSTGTVEVTVTANNSSNTDWDFSISQDATYISAEKTSTGLSITGEAAGTATITVTADGDKTKTTTITVTVSNVLVNSITVSLDGTVLESNETSVTKDTSITLNVAIGPDNATNKNWTATVGDDYKSYIEITAQDVDTGTITVKGLATGAGQITIASADGNKTITVAITVVGIPAEGITLSNENDIVLSLAGETAGSTTITVTVTPENADVLTWAVAVKDGSDTGIVDFTTTGTSGSTITITATAVGTTTLVVTALGGTDVIKEISVTVNAILVNEITFSGEGVSDNTITIKDGGTADVTVAVGPTNATDKSLSVSSDAEGIATATYDEDTGTITITAKGSTGTAHITVSANDNGVDSCSATLTVVVDPILVSKITADPESVSLIVGGHEQDVTITVDAAATNPEWSITSYDSSVVSVTNNEDGTITISPVGEGETTVVITATDGSDVTCEISVTVAEFGISATPDPLNITVGKEDGTITVTVKHDYSDDEDWTFSIDPDDDSIITAVQSGNTLTVTAVAAGTAVITFTADGDSSKTTTVTVYVTNPVTIQISDENGGSLGTYTTSVGATVTLDEILNDISYSKDGYTVSWELNGETITSADEITIAADTEYTLQAVLTGNEVTISIVGADSESLGTYKTAVGETVTLDDMLNGIEYSKEGYTVSWTLNGNAIESGDEITIAANTDYTLQAVLTGNAVTIQINNESGDKIGEFETKVGDSPALTDIIDGIGYEEPEYNHLTGWTLTVDGNEVTYDTYISITAEGTYVLTPILIPYAKVTISAGEADGIEITENWSTEEFELNKSYDLPNATDNYTLSDNYELTGWTLYNSSNETIGTYTIGTDTTFTVTAAGAYTLIPTVVHYYTVSYASIESVTGTDLKIYDNDNSLSLTSLSVTNSTRRDLTGWYIETEDGAVLGSNYGIYGTSDSVVVTSNLVVWAILEEDYYGLTTNNAMNSTMTTDHAGTTLGTDSGTTYTSKISHTTMYNKADNVSEYVIYNNSTLDDGYWFRTNTYVDISSAGSGVEGSTVISGGLVDGTAYNFYYSLTNHGSTAITLTIYHCTTGYMDSSTTKYEAHTLTIAEGATEKFAFYDFVQDKDMSNFLTVYQVSGECEDFALGIRMMVEEFDENAGITGFIYIDDSMDGFTLSDAWTAYEATGWKYMTALEGATVSLTADAEEGGIGFVLDGAYTLLGWYELDNNGNELELYDADYSFTMSTDNVIFRPYVVLTTSLTKTAKLTTAVDGITISDITFNILDDSAITLPSKDDATNETGRTLEKWYVADEDGNPYGGSYGMYEFGDTVTIDITTTNLTIWPVLSDTFYDLDVNDQHPANMISSQAGTVLGVDAAITSYISSTTMYNKTDNVTEYTVINNQTLPAGYWFRTNTTGTGDLGGDSLTAGERYNLYYALTNHGSSTITISMYHCTNGYMNSGTTNGFVVRTVTLAPGETVHIAIYSYKQLTTTATNFLTVYQVAEECEDYALGIRIKIEKYSEEDAVSVDFSINLDGIDGFTVDDSYYTMDDDGTIMSYLVGAKCYTPSEEQITYDTSKNFKGWYCYDENGSLVMVDGSSSLSPVYLIEPANGFTITSSTVILVPVFED